MPQIFSTLNLHEKHTKTVNHSSENHTHFILEVKLQEKGTCLVDLRGLKHSLVFKWLNNIKGTEKGTGDQTPFDILIKLSSYYDSNSF